MFSDKYFGKAYFSNKYWGPIGFIHQGFKEVIKFTLFVFKKISFKIEY